MHVYVYMCMPCCICAGQKTNRFSPITMWVSEIKIRLTGLLASAFTC